MRKDVYVSNDSGGMSLLSSSMLERAIDDGREDDAGFVSRHEAILSSLVGDDSFIARVVVGEPLRPDEDSEWIARYRWALDVPCGKLLVCGGYDPGVLGQWLEEGAHDGVGVVEIPPGKYLVDVYTYLHSMNGRMIVDQEWNEKLGAWFRRDHPGRAYPSWVAGELAMFNDDDPGHEKEWAALADSAASGALAIESAPIDWIGFLFHLQPFDPEAVLNEPEDGGGWFGAGQGLRRPAKLPLGVPAEGAQDPEYREALSPLLGEDEKEKGDDAGVKTLEVWSRVKDRPLTEIGGGPVVLPLAQLPGLFHLAHLLSSWSHPEFRVEAPRLQDLAARFTGRPGMAVSIEADALSIRFEPGGPRMPSRLAALGKETWTVLPSGSRVEVLTCQLDQTVDPEIGLLRFRGETRGEGASAVLEVGDAYPAVRAEVLRSALSLAVAAEDESRLVLDDPEEAARVLEEFMRKHDCLLMTYIPARANTATRDGAEIRLKNPDDTVIHFMAAIALRQRFPDVWPMHVQDDEEDEDV